MCVDDVTAVRATWFWHDGIHLVSKTETITLKGNTSTNPLGLGQSLPLFFKTVDLTLHSCSAGTFLGTLALSVGNAPQTLLIP
jgi:hypothetical protein